MGRYATGSIYEKAGRSETKLMLPLPGESAKVRHLTIVGSLAGTAETIASEILLLRRGSISKRPDWEKRGTFEGASKGGEHTLCNSKFGAGVNSRSPSEQGLCEFLGAAGQAKGARHDCETESGGHSGSG